MWNCGNPEKLYAQNSLILSFQYDFDVTHKKIVAEGKTLSMSHKSADFKEVISIIEFYLITAIVFISNEIMQYKCAHLFLNRIMEQYLPI